MTYLLAQIFQNGGFVLLRRDPQVISERLIVPNIWLTKKVIPRIRFIPFFLPAWAQREATGLPMPTMTSSFTMRVNYAFYHLMPTGSMEHAYLVGVLHAVGIVLCVGLILQQWWSDRLQPYLPLYWLFTLFYCLPLGVTLTFLSSSQQWVNLPFWVGSVVLLAFLVDSGAFLIMTTLGCG